MCDAEAQLGLLWASSLSYSSVKSNTVIAHSAKPHAMFYDVSNKCNASTLLIQIACAFLTISRHAGMKLSPHTEWAKAYTSKCIYLSH